MDFYSLLDDVLELLRRRGRVTYRALKRQFHLDDDVLDDLKEELIKAQRVAVDENGDVLVWVGDVGSTSAPTPPSPQSVRRPAAEGDRAVPVESPAAEPRTVEAERRQLTVLFCDLVDSTVLASQLDPDEWREVVRAYQEACAKVIARYEGQIAQYLGDGLLVYFGYPQAHEDLERLLQKSRVALDDVAPLLADLLSVPIPEGRYSPVLLTPPQQRQRTLDALVALLLAEAERQPVLVVWEDLHWADPSTLELLGLGIDQVPTAPLLILVTSRPEFRPPWASRPHLTRLALGRLPHIQVEEMVQQLTLGKSLPAEVLAQVVAKTDGVPLFGEELVKMILDSGLIREEADCYALTGPLPPLAIPATLQDSLMARLDRLATAKTVAQLGAVLGREFAYELIRAVAPQDEAKVQQGLAHLVDAELLYQRGPPPQARYLFKHALIQETAYQSLLKSSRQQHHRRVLHMLEAHFPESGQTQPELLAYHASAGAVWGKALVYSRQAASKATSQSANREAVAYLEQALTALRQLPDRRDTQEHAIDIRVDQAIPLLERAVEICQLEKIPVWFPASASYLGTAYTLSGRIEEALVLLEQAVKQAPSINSRIHSLWVVQLGQAYRLAGRLDDAVHMAHYALRLASEYKERGWEAYAFRLLGELYMPCKVSQAKTYYGKALALAQLLGMHPLLAHCHMGLGTLLHKIGQKGQAYSEFIRAVELYRRIEMAFWLLKVEAALAHGEDHGP
jgi:class 3 adenylate cyclase